MSASRILRALTCAAAIGLAAPAQAQVFQSIERNVDTMLGRALDLMPRGLRGLRFGVGPSMGPHFLGDSQLRVAPAPVISLRYRNLLEIDNNNIRVNFVGNWGDLASPSSHWSAGPQVNIDFGRSEKDSPKLTGLRGIPASFETGAFVGYNDGDTHYRLRARKDITGTTNGWIVDAIATTRVVDTERLYVNLGAQLVWANRRYMQVWFGITPTQSAASGLPVYDAHSGLHDATVTAVAEYVLNDRWSLFGTAALTRLMGSASGSPLVKQRGSPNQPYAAVFAVYAF